MPTVFARAIRSWPRIEVTAGQRVAQGDRVGTAGETFHFGARIGDVYIDPAALFGADRTEVVLVPHDRPISAPSGRAPTARSSRAMAFGSNWFAAAPVRDITATLADWQARRRSCTPVADSVPARPPDPNAPRRIAVLVGGLGSSSGQAAIMGLDTTALGFDDGDVIRFSYAGGRVPGSGSAVGDVPSRDYMPADTLGDLRVAGARLAQLLRDVADAAPGAVIDVMAHSQGGIVSRLAIEELAGRPDDAGLLPRLGVVATIGTSHQGADVATLVRLIAELPGGAAVLEALQAGAGTAIEPDAVAVGQLAEGSRLLRELAARTPPAAVDVWSIGARGDVVVAGPRARLPGATNVVVAVDGLVTDHERLPAAPAVTRELGLALAGRPPTCEGVLEALIDAASGAAISWVESGLGLVPGVGAPG